MGQIRVTDFDLKNTMDSGQYFAYSEKNGVFEIIHRSTRFTVAQEKDKLIYAGISEKELKNFFRLDEDHSKILKELSKDKHLLKAIEYCRGLRLIRQDPWQCTVGFICSQNSNIPRIKNNIQYMIDNFGNDSFPGPKDIDTENLREAKLGYREKYLKQVCNQVDDKFFESLRGLSYDQAKEKLLELPGVGPKVADCILLFSLDKLETFPVDVWVKRLMSELYGVEDNVHDYATKKFGANAGYAQQYLFHWRRNAKLK